MPRAMLSCVSVSRWSRMSWSRSCNIRWRWFMWWLLYDGLMPYCSLVDILGEATMALGECQGMRIGGGDALSVAFDDMHYNFCRIHKTLHVTPAMAAGVTDRVSDIADIAELLESV